MKSMQQVLMDALPRIQEESGITSSSHEEHPMEGAYCCLECRKTIKKLNLFLFGKPYRPMPVCNCVTERLKREREERELEEKRMAIRRIYGEGLIDEELKRASFDGFEVREGTEMAYKVAKDFAENFKEQEAGLYLFGSVGTGKSHLAAAIHNHLVERGYSSVYIDVTQLFGLAKSTFRDNSKKSDQDYIQAAIRCEMLTLDEIGLTTMTEYEYKILFQILNGRKGKLTNFTSNLGLDELERWFKYDRQGNPLDEHGRLFDRLIGGSLPIKINAESYRKYKAMKRLQSYR